MEESQVEGHIQRLLQCPAIVGVIEILRDIGLDALEGRNITQRRPKSLVLIGGYPIGTAGPVISGKLAITDEGHGRFKELLFREDPAGAGRSEITELVAGTEITGAISSAGQTDNVFPVIDIFQTGE